MDLELHKIKKQLKKSNLPIYETIMNVIHKQIVSGKWADGTKLPADKELAASLEVNHITLAKALNKLKEIGLLSRRRAQGTFVSSGSGDIACSKRIAVVFDDANEATFHQKLFIYLHLELEKAGFSMVFFSSGGSPEKQLSQLEQISRDPSMHGCIVWSILDRKLAAKIMTPSSKDFPLVILDKFYEGFEHDYAGFDNFGCAQRMASDILKAGCKKFIWFEQNSEHNWSSICERFEGLQAVLGRKRKLERYSEKDISSLRNLPPETAIVASTGNCAILLKKNLPSICNDAFATVFLSEIDIESDRKHCFDGFNSYLFDSQSLAKAAVSILNRRFNTPTKGVIHKVSNWKKLDRKPAQKTLELVSL